MFRNHEIAVCQDFLANAIIVVDRVVPGAVHQIPPATCFDPVPGMVLTGLDFTFDTQYIHEKLKCLTVAITDGNSVLDDTGNPSLLFTVGFIVIPEQILIIAKILFQIGISVCILLIVESVRRYRLCSGGRQGGRENSGTGSRTNQFFTLSICKFMRNPP